MSGACILVFAVIAAAAPARPAVTIGPRAAATTTDPPRLTAGYRAMRISLRHLAPDAGEPAAPRTAKRRGLDDGAVVARAGEPDARTAMH
jgi:hypothetical protein